jgi:hypothetical protein
VALLATGRAQASPSVWVIDDGEKIRRDATDTPFERGERNPVWRPGEPVRVFAVRNESVALQVVVEADERPLGSVSVDLSPLSGPEGAVVGRPAERFVESFVEVRRASGGRTRGESLGWEPGAGPAKGAWLGPVPDALVPVELAAAWVPYPMRVAPRTNGIVWIDLNIPRVQPAGAYRGTLDVREGPQPLASIPVELTVADAQLPDDTPAAAAFYDPEELSQRVGGDAEPRLWMLLHAHRVSALHDATTPEDVIRQRAALDGSLYTPAHGYVGAAQGRGDGVLALGAYGGLGDPDAGALAALAGAVASARVPADADVFVYADDEDCASPRGAGWSALIRASRDPAVARVRVGWTCSKDPASQPVDLPLLQAADYDTTLARAARTRGKEPWIYNGVQPHTGTFLLDAEAVAPRVNGWIAEMNGIRRWFYWESTYWYGRNGRHPIDPFAEAESFRNDDGDWANGDGVLVYPGRQRDGFDAHSLGFEGVLPSIRLKNWRRGLEDAGYLRLARARDPQRADAVARALIASALEGAGKGKAPAWSLRGDAFHQARRALLAIATAAPATHAKSDPPAIPATLGSARTDSERPGQSSSTAAIATLLAAGIAVGLVRRARRP